MPTTIPTPVRIEASAITSGVVNGAGVFDVIMTGIGAHLKAEYEKGRITGGDYTKAYIALTEAALANATQFLIQREGSFWGANQTAEQLALIREQTEVQRAQTLDTRTDGATVTGVLGKQKDLYAQQVTSYKRDIEIKAAKVFSDAWITMKTIDEGLGAPDLFSLVSIDGALSTLKNNVPLA